MHPLLILPLSRPAGLLPFFGKVQLTPVGVFLSGYKKAAWENVSESTGGRLMQVARQTLEHSISFRK